MKTYLVSKSLESVYQFRWKSRLGERVRGEQLVVNPRHGDGRLQIPSEPEIVHDDLRLSKEK